MRLSIIALAILLLLAVISAVEVQMKEEFASGETILVKISGNFLEPVLKEEISFYEEHVRVPFDYNIGKIEDEYYIYAKQQKGQGKYSIEIKNAKYIKGSEIIKEDLKIPFYITNQTADFSIDKGFIITNSNFFISVQNLQNNKIIIISKFEEKETSTELKSGEIKKINFEVKDVKSGLKTLEITSGNLAYKIPVYIHMNKTLEEKKREFRFEPGELNISMATNSEINRIVYLYNTGDEILEDIEISVSNSLKEIVRLSVYQIPKLEPNSSVKIEMNINSSDKESSIYGQLKTKTPLDSYRYTLVYLNFVRGYTPKEGEYGEKSEPPGNLIDIKDLISEEENGGEKPSSSGKIIGWTIVAIILILLVWFFLKRYRVAKGFPTALEKARK